MSELSLETSVALTVLELLLTGTLRTDTHTHTRRHTSNENSISAIHSIHLSVYGHLGDKPTGWQMTGRQANWATTNWATRFGQLGDMNQVKWRRKCESMLILLTNGCCEMTFAYCGDAYYQHSSQQNRIYKFSPNSDLFQFFQSIKYLSISITASSLQRAIAILR